MQVEDSIVGADDTKERRRCKRWKLNLITYKYGAAYYFSDLKTSNGKLSSVNSYSSGIWQESRINQVDFPMARAEDAGDYSIITSTYLFEQHRR